MVYSILRTARFSSLLSERMLAFSSRKNKNRHGGGSVQQPLAYLDPTYSLNGANAGSDLLKQNGLIVRPVIPRIGGGSVQQPLPYLDPTFSSPSADGPGNDLLKQNGLILRPVIPRIGGGTMRKHRHGGWKSGGFLPSVMKGVVNAAVVTAPLAAVAAKKMLYNKTRKGGSMVTTGQRGGGKKEDWARNREAAKGELEKYGKPSALNVNKYAALKRKSEDDAEEFLTDYILRKRKTGKKKSKANKPKNSTAKKPKATKAEVKTASLWKDLLDRAKKNLQKFGKPSGANVTKLASLHKKGVNTKQFVANFQTRKKYVAVKTKRNTYKNNLQSAKEALAPFGKPTAANLAKYVSLMRKGDSTAPVEQTVKSRVKAGIVTTVKPTSKSPPPPAQNMEKVKRNLALLKKKIKTVNK